MLRGLCCGRRVRRSRGLELGALELVVLVVAVVERHLVVAHVDHLVGHGTHQVLVVADEHDGPREVNEGLLEDVD